jgi:hypothetical protein
LWCLGGQGGEDFRGDGFECGGVADFDAAQERPDGGGGSHVVEEAVHRAVAQDAEVVDAVGAGGHVGDDGEDCRGGVGACGAGDGEASVGEDGEAGVAGDAQQWDEACVGDDTPVVAGR